MRCRSRPLAPRGRRPFTEMLMAKRGGPSPPRAPGAEAAAAAVGDAPPAPAVCEPPFPPPEAGEPRQVPVIAERGGTHKEVPRYPGAPRDGETEDGEEPGGGSPILLEAVGIWRRGRYGVGRGAGRRRIRAWGGAAQSLASPRRAPLPPPAARGLPKAAALLRWARAARKSREGCVNPALPLTQPQPRLIRGTEGKEAN